MIKTATLSMSFSKIKTAISRDKQEIVERLARYTKIDETTGCHLWTGAKDKDGYGQLSLTYIKGNYIVARAHRIQYCLYNTAGYDETLHVLHSCDNPTCINPAHLMQGTPKNNVHDCMSKKRRHMRLRSNTGNNVLTESTAQSIRNLYATNKYTQRNLASIFRTTQSNVSLVVNHKHWSNVKA